MFRVSRTTTAGITFKISKEKEIATVFELKSSNNSQKSR